MTTSTRIATDVGGTFTDLVAIQSDADGLKITTAKSDTCLLYTSPSPRDATLSRMPSSA